MPQTPVNQKIRENWEAFRGDPEMKAATEKLDKEKLNEEFFKCREHVATFVNFQNYKTSLQRIKAQQSTLDQQTEQIFASRFADAVGTYQAFVSSAENAARLCATSGVDKVFERHAKKLFWQAPLNPGYPHFTEMLKTMGMSEDDISRNVAHLKINDWDILRVHGGDGTLSGLVNHARQQIPVLQDKFSAVKLHGLPVIEGNIHTINDWFPVIGFAFIVALAIILQPEVVVVAVLI